MNNHFYGMEAEEAAARIRETGVWLIDECEKLCRLAGLFDEWNDADADGFEVVVYKAAEIPGVDLEG